MLTSKITIKKSELQQVNELMNALPNLRMFRVIYQKNKGIKLLAYYKDRVCTASGADMETAAEQFLLKLNA